MSGAGYFFMFRSLDDLKKNAKLTKHQEVKEDPRIIYFTAYLPGAKTFMYIPVFRIRKYLDLPDPKPDPSVRVTGPDPPIIKQIDFFCFVTFS
jgi:hypothetical protein